jgi:hypothetical protein
MSNFTTATADLEQLDPLKRVNYSFGLVLGVDEFQQEQIHFLSKHRSHARLLHGYGTACGLRVSVENDATPNVEVRVTSGVAVNPQGQEIHVSRLMCTKVNDWLKKNISALEKIYGAPPTKLSLCVVLCYHECETDEVPVPGEPCRTQDQSMAPAHIAESFELKLCLNLDALPVSPPALDSPLLRGFGLRPSQPEEDAVLRFRDLLQHTRFTYGAAQYVTRDQFLDLVRQLAVNSAIGSPPFGTSTLYLHPLDAAEFLRSAFLVWVTEVRPLLQRRTPAGDCEAPDEQCVLLAKLTFDVGNNWMVLGKLDVDESRRPFLLQTRLLQEGALLALLGEGGDGGCRAAFPVAAGTFQIAANSATALGPTFNQLNANHPLSLLPGQFLLNWSGPQPYANPLRSPPQQHTYIVNGTPFLSVPGNREIFEVLAFRDDGILMSILDTAGGATAKGFMVEIVQVMPGA